MYAEIQLVRVMVGYALARAGSQRARAREGRTELGASALEWAIISAILVTAALLIGGIVKGVIDRRSKEIENG
jgi:hypothetical protein